MKKVCKLFKKAVLKNNDLWKRKDGFGLNELLGICAALIIAAFIVIPGLKDFSKKVMYKLDDWWKTEIKTEIFCDSVGD